jgi:MGT family glycosyltransferase
MSRGLVIAYPTHGHLAPILPVLSELARRGEEIICYGTGRSRSRIEAAGARFRLYGRRHDDFNPNPPTEGLFSDMARLALLSEQLLPGLLEEIRALEPDYLLFDTKSLWGRLAAAVLGIRAVTLSVVFAIQPDSIAPVDLVERLYAGAPRDAMLKGMLGLGDYYDAARRMRRRWGVSLPSIIDYLGNPQALNIIFTSREFQLDGESFGPEFRFVGPSIPDGRDNAIDFPFTELTGAPLVYISLGTTFNAAPEFYRACVEAFGGTPWQIVLSTGGADPELPTIPANCMIRRFVPQLKLLERASVFITHGGMNSANEGLWQGVPLVVVPQRGDQYLVAGRVAELGAGRCVLPQNATAERLRECVSAMIRQPQFAANAKKLGATLRSAGGYRAAADAILQYTRG